MLAKEFYSAVLPQPNAIFNPGARHSHFTKVDNLDLLGTRKKN